MKTLRLIAIAGIVAMMAISCQEKPADQEKQGPAELVSFGFYQEDNAEIIDRDYVASIISQETVIRIPDGGAGKTLVARIEVGENDEAVVNGEPITDGKATVDAAYPIDIIVTDSASGLSSAYVVKVGKILGAEMVYLATYTESGAELDGDFHMRVNPVDGLPYIVYVRNLPNEENQASMVRWNGSAFEAVGQLGFTGGATAEEIRLPMVAFDSEGTPYISCRDSNNPDKEVSVYKYSGSWTKLGNTDEECSSSYEPLIFVNPANDYPVVCYQGRNVHKAYMVSSAYDGSSMSPVSKVNPTTNNYCRSRSVTVGNVVYVLSVFSNGGYWLYKYENNTWTPVIENYHQTNTHFINVAIDADSQGNVYALFADNYAGGDYVVQVYQVDFEKSTFVPIGNQLTSMGASDKYAMFDFAINPVTGQMVAIYRDAEFETTGIHFGYVESDTGLWSDFTKIGTSATERCYPYIDYAPNGDGYAVVSSENGLDLYKIQTEEDILPE